jgi:hypothetical protein
LLKSNAFAVSDHQLIYYETLISASSVQPSLLRDLKVRKIDGRGSRDLTDQVSLSDEKWSDAVSSMYETLSNKIPKENQPGGLSFLHPSRFSSQRPIQSSDLAIASIPSKVSSLHPSLTYEMEISCETNCIIPSIPQLHHQVLPSTSHPSYSQVKQDFITLIQQTFTQAAITSVEIITRGQSSNIEWYHHKEGSIGSSNISSIRRIVQGGKFTRAGILRMGPTSIPTVNAVTACLDPRIYGLHHEAHARDAYMQVIANHTNQHNLQSLA